MLQSLPARRVTRFVPLLALATVIVAAPRPAAADASEPALDRAVFEQLKSLAGRWEGQVDDTSATPVALELQVTSNGTAVLERVSRASLTR